MKNTKDLQSLESNINAAPPRHASGGHNMKRESKNEYVTRAAVNTLDWLTDRSANCHPLAHSQINRLQVMLAPYLQQDLSGGKIALRRLKKTERNEVKTLLHGFIWALV